MTMRCNKIIKFSTNPHISYKHCGVIKMYIKFIALFFFLILLNNCKNNPINIEGRPISNIWGVWENSEQNPQSTINGKWIPTNLHIGKTDEENIIRVRTIYISCTDSYPEFKNSSIGYSQYDGLKISVLFITDSTANFTVEYEDSGISFQFYKTDKNPYWGMCD